MIGCVPAVRKASSLKKGRIFISDSLPELIEEPRFTDSRLSNDGDGLASPFFGSFKSI
jgi:hypothetical protein